jgi:D-ribose pyranase
VAFRFWVSIVASKRRQAVKKTGGLLQSELAYVVACLGHGDSIVVADAGLPCPIGPKWIDLAVSPGVVGLHEVLSAVATEMKVDRLVIASQLTEGNPGAASSIRECFPDARVEIVDHEELKSLSRSAKAIVRTGEYTPFANVILVAGVPF